MSEREQGRLRGEHAGRHFYEYARPRDWDSLSAEIVVMLREVHA